MELLDEAIDDYTQAISFDPNYDVAYYNRSLVYDKKDDYEMVFFIYF